MNRLSKSKIQPVKQIQNWDIPSLIFLSSAVASADHYLSHASQDPTPDVKNFVLNIIYSLSNCFMCY